MKAIFDENTANAVHAEDKQVRKEETQMMRAVSEALHKTFPNCNIEIKAKIAIEGLLEEELNVPY